MSRGPAFVDAIWTRYDALADALWHRTRNRLAQVDIRLGGADGCHLAHNWYLVGAPKPETELVRTIIARDNDTLRRLYARKSREFRMALRASKRNGVSL